jgi:hypothetical protein
MTYLRTTEETQFTQIDEYFMNIDLDNRSNGQVTPVTLANSDLNEIIDSELENDKQSLLIEQLLTASTSYSSKPMLERIRILKEMLGIMSKLLEEIKRDRKKYIEMDNAFKVLTETLFDLNKKCSSNLYTKLSKLKRAKHELENIVDVLYPKDNVRPLEPLTETDFIDNKLSINTLGEICQEISREITISLQECQEVKAGLQHFHHESIEPETKVVQKRTRFWQRRIPHMIGATTTGAAIGGGVAGTLVGTTIAGAVGTVVIGTMVFPPVAAVVVCVFGGAIVIGGLTAAILAWMKSSYMGEQNKMLNYLKQLAKLVHELIENADEMEDIMIKSKEDTSDLQNNLSAISNSLQSEKHRSRNYELCTDAVRSCQKVIDGINELQVMDFANKWRKERNLLFNYENQLLLNQQSLNQIQN